MEEIAQKEYFIKNKQTYSLKRLSNKHFKRSRSSDK